MIFFFNKKKSNHKIFNSSAKTTTHPTNQENINWSRMNWKIVSFWNMVNLKEKKPNVASSFYILNPWTPLIAPFSWNSFSISPLFQSTWNSSPIFIQLEDLILLLLVKLPFAPYTLCFIQFSWLIIINFMHENIKHMVYLKYMV